MELTCTRIRVELDIVSTPGADVGIKELSRLAHELAAQPLKEALNKRNVLVTRMSGSATAMPPINNFNLGS